MLVTNQPCAFWEILQEEQKTSRLTVRVGNDMRFGENDQRLFFQQALVLAMNTAPQECPRHPIMYQGSFRKICDLADC